MTELLCVDGILLDDAQDSVCIGGVAVSAVCIGGNIVWERANASAITAEITCAPSPDNPGGADPSTGSLTGLEDTFESEIPDGGNKALLLSVHSITGGTGPYTVDFTEVQWFISYDNPAVYGAEVFWGLNMNIVPLTGAGSNSVSGSSGITQPPLGSPVNPGAIVTGVGAGDFAAFGPRLTVPSVPFTPFFFSHNYNGVPASVVTITDSLGASVQIQIPTCGDTWTVQPDAGGGGPLAP
jgi:hypothetical protein